jgi:hypothetical protein
MGRFHRRILASLAASAMLAGILVGVTQGPAAATVTAVKGSACSFYVNVGLFGGPLMRRGCGGTTSRSFSDGVFTLGSTTLTSATAAFTALDVGATLSGHPDNFAVPAGTTITSFSSPTAVVMSAPATRSVAASANENTTLTYPVRPGDLGFSPTVSLPPGGSATAVTQTDADGAKAQYGPAVIHGGVWPENVGNPPPPSGPQAASTQGTPAGGTVTSSADIDIWRDGAGNPAPMPAGCEAGFSPPCTVPGGFGPMPVWGDSVHVQCSASQTSVSGSTTLSNAFVAHATDSGGAPLPSATEVIPNNPPVNLTKSGVITNVGDVFTVVYNEQIQNPDGSLTVNGMHMYLFGPVAVGDLVRGQVNCGTTPSPLTASDTVAPTCGIPVVRPNGPTDPTPQVPRSELVGVFDAGTGSAPSGLSEIKITQVTNGTVEVGQPSSPNAYLRFVPGQTGPLAMTATRIDESQPMTWSFDAVDTAGHTTHCTGVKSPPTIRTDIAVFRPSNGVWYTNLGESVGFGTNGDIPVPGDYDGNGTTDIAVFRPSNGVWYVRNGASTGWGTNGDIPVPGDYDGNGTTDIAVFRPSNGVWYVRNGVSTGWGTNGDIPVPGDYDGNGTTDIAVFRPSNGVWYVRNGVSTGWGTNGDIPVPGDYDGNGTTDIAVFRPSNGVWYVRNGVSTGWGTNGDIPVPGNYFADGITRIAVFRPSNGSWYVNGGVVTTWGSSGDIPLSLPAAIRRAFFP